MEKKTYTVDRSASNAVRRARVTVIIIGALFIIASIAAFFDGTYNDNGSLLTVAGAFLLAAICLFLYAGVINGTAKIVEHVENRDAVLKENAEFVEKKDPELEAIHSPAWRDTTSGA